MTPQPYLTPLAKKYFKAIEKILKERGMDDNAFSMELSMIATEFAKYEECNKKLNEGKIGIDAFVNTYANGTKQINPYHTISKEAFNAIKAHSPKFGLNPADFEKIKSAIKEPEPENPIDKI